MQQCSGGGFFLMTDNRQIIYGTRAVIEAMRAGNAIEKIMVEDGKRNELIAEMIREAKNLEIPYQFIPPQAFKRYTRQVNHQGVLAFVSPIQFVDVFDVVQEVIERGETPFVLILDKITDTRNFGAIIRTAECNGVHAVVIPSRGSAPITEDAVKTSAGALFSVPLCRSHNLKETLEEFKNYGMQIAACTEKGALPLDKADLIGPLAVIMGNEGEGISLEYLKRSDLKIAIPMYGKIESLNVSVATGIVLYEINRQRQAL